MLNIEIKPEDIEKLVKETFINTALGKTINDTLGKVLGGYNSPLEEAIKQIVRKMAIELIEERYKDRVREAVVKAIEARITNELIDATVNTAMERIIKAASDKY